MNRGEFLKGIFGAAVVAAMPKSVVDQIEQIPELQPKPIVLEKIPPNLNFKPVLDTLSKVLCLYSKEELIGFSTDFFLAMKQELIQDPPNEDCYGYATYTERSRSWKVQVNKMIWNDPRFARHYLFAEESLQMVLADKNVKLMGTVLVTELGESLGLGEAVQRTAILEGNGALIFEQYDNTRPSE